MSAGQQVAVWPSVEGAGAKTGAKEAMCYEACAGGGRGGVLCSMGSVFVIFQSCSWRVLWNRQEGIGCGSTGKSVRESLEQGWHDVSNYLKTFI